MAYDRFLIAPFSTGLQRNLKPWLILDDAFQELQNVYVYRGRIRKRFGTRLMGEGWSTAVTQPLFSRLRINLGNTNGAGNISVTVPGTIFKIGQLFSIGTEIFTVIATGTPAVMKTTGSATVHTYDTTSGALVINGAAAATPVWFYSAEPVMGLTTYEFGAINANSSYAFDTQFAYLFQSGYWQRSGNLQLHGDNLDFVWSINAEGLLPGNFPTIYITNNQIVNPNGLGSLLDDPMWNTTTDATILPVTWAPFSYSPSAALNPGNQQPYTVTATTNAGGTIIANYVQSCLMIVFFKDRFLLLNTIENNANGANAWSSGAPTTTGITPANYVTSTNRQYQNRCRYSKIGSPFDRNAWLDKNQTYVYDGGAMQFSSGGGFLDCPTEEEILSAGFIKDRLIVYFEMSTWELAYTGNQVQPFVWQKLNTELGCSSTFSTISFDKSLLNVGTTGIMACNGSNVEEIDDNIPDEVFTIRRDDLNIERVCGIRDDFVDVVYWAYPSIEQPSSQVYPSQILCYNYKTSSWAIFDDSITAFGYFEQQPGVSWANSTATWEQANQVWVSGNNAENFRQVIAGNQQGFVFICDSEASRNAPNIQITNMATSGTGILVTAIDHMFQTTYPTEPLTGDYVNIENFQGCTINGLTSGIFAVNFVSKDSFFIQATLVGTYTGGGTASRVSNIYLKSKAWNPYIDKGNNLLLAKIDFGITRTSDGEVVVDYNLSDSDMLMVDTGEAPGVNPGTNVLETHPYPLAIYPFEQFQDTLWHQIYFQAQGETVSIVIYMNNAQMRDAGVAYSIFELQGLILHTSKTSNNLQ